jgi:hypothetical protein
MKGTLAKILAGVGVAVAVLVLALGALVAVFWDEAKVRGQNLVAIFTEEPEYAEGFANREETLEYLTSHPEDFSLVVRNASEGSSKAEIEYLSDEPNPLASTKKIVVLAAYAKEASNGNLDPEEEVPVSEWEKYYVPNADGGAHPAAMESLGIATDENGAATDPEATATLDEMASAMISVSDNAATDYFIERLGQEKTRAVIEEENLAGQSPILPISGSMLVWNGPDGGGAPNLAQMSREEYTAAVMRATESYASGEYPGEWREGRAPLGSLVEQREMAAKYETKGAAEDFARIMAGAAAGEFISPEASGVMRRHLEWPMESEANKETFEAFGAKGGSLAGVLNQAAYAAPKAGAFSGETRVVILFTRGMSVSAWLGATQSEGYSDFVDALATDEIFAEKVERQIREKEGSNGS